MVTYAGVSDPFHASSICHLILSAGTPPAIVIFLVLLVHTSWPQKMVQRRREKTWCSAHISASACPPPAYSGMDAPPRCAFHCSVGRTPHLHAACHKHGAGRAPHAAAGRTARGLGRCAHTRARARPVRAQHQLQLLPGIGRHAQVHRVSRHILCCVAGAMHWPLGVWGSESEGGARVRVHNNTAGTLARCPLTLYLCKNRKCCPSAHHLSCHCVQAEGRKAE